MAKIDLTINEERLKHAIQRAKERNIVIPTLEQQLHPETIPAKFKKELESIGLWDIHPRNLFRITWRPASGHRTIRPDDRKSRMAFHRQLLPRRCL